jgi:hypothetical protein
MINQKIEENKLVILGSVAVFLVVVITYRNLFFAYFEQDEWYSYGQFIFNITEHGFLASLKETVFGMFPVNGLFYFFNYVFFGIQNISSLIALVILILLNIFLWVKNIFSITNSAVVSIGSVLLGFLSTAGSQAVTWVSPAVGYQLAFLSINIGLFCVIKITKEFSLKTLSFMILSLLLIYANRPNSYFLGLVVPFVYLTLKDGRISKRSVIYLFSIMVFLTVCIYVLLPSSNSSSRYVNSLIMIPFNAFFIPIKAISQIICGDENNIFRLSEYLAVHRHNIFPSDGYQQSINTEHISTILSLVILVGMAGFYRNLSYGNQQIVLLFSVLYLFSFSGNFIDRHSTGGGYLESRYYFIPSFFLGVILLVFIEALFQRLKRVHNFTVRKFAIAGLACTIAGIWLANADAIEHRIDGKTKLTNKRLEILEYIEQEQVSKIDRDYILYIKEINTPDGYAANGVGRFFQAGLLYPLLVQSFDSGRFDHMLFRKNINDILWNPDFEGVVDTGKQKVGLYYTYELMLRELAVQKVNLNRDLFCIEFDYEKLKDNMQHTSFNLVAYHDCTREIRAESY